jgi:hypothetical protein
MPELPRVFLASERSLEWYDQSDDWEVVDLLDASGDLRTPSLILRQFHKEVQSAESALVRFQSVIILYGSGLFDVANIIKQELTRRCGYIIGMEDPDSMEMDGRTLVHGGDAYGRMNALRLYAPEHRREQYASNTPLDIITYAEDEYGEWIPVINREAQLEDLHLSTLTPF